MRFKAVTDEHRKLNLNWESINQYLSKWKPGTPINVEIVRRQKTKSTPMRRYYFGVVMPILLDTCGYERDEDLAVHRHLKILYFRVQKDKRGIYRDKDIPSVFSDDSPLPVSTKKKFVEFVVRKCAENGGYVPDPGEEI